MGKNGKHCHRFLENLCTRKLRSRSVLTHARAHTHTRTRTDGRKASFCRSVLPQMQETTRKSQDIIFCDVTGHRPCVFTGQLSVQGTLSIFPGNSSPPLKDEQFVLCLFSGYEHLALRAVMAPAYQVHLGLYIPEVEQLDACLFRPLMYVQDVGRWEQQVVRNR